MIAAFTNSTRPVQTFRPSWIALGPTTLDTAIGAYRMARDACDYETPLTAAYRKLGAANRMLPANRRACRSAAFREINAIRAQRRAAWARRDRAVEALDDAGGCFKDVDVLDAAPVVGAGFAGVSIADDPDMVSMWGGRA